MYTSDGVPLQRSPVHWPLVRQLKQVLHLRQHILQEGRTSRDSHMTTGHTQCTSLRLRHRLSTSASSRQKNACPWKQRDKQIHHLPQIIISLPSLSPVPPTLRSISFPTHFFLLSSPSFLPSPLLPPFSLPPPLPSICPSPSSRGQWRDPAR